MLELSTTLLVDIVVPIVVGFLRDIEFDCVIASCYCGEVPFKLLNFASIVQFMKSSYEEETN